MLMDLFEMVWGARMFPCYFRIGGLAADLPEGFIEKVWEFVKLFPERIKDYHNLLTKNRIWIARTKDVGVMTKDQAIDWGWSGTDVPGVRG